MGKLEKYYGKAKRLYPDYHFSWEIFTELILENVAKKPYWLDIGAGTNIVIEEQPGADLAVGMDIERPKELFFDTHRCPYCLATAYKLPFKNESFDFVSSRYTFEHLEFPEKALAEVSRILKPGGVFIMQTTNINNPMVFLSGLIPFPLKRILLRRFFKDNPSGTFKTHYKINKTSSIKSSYGSLILKRLILVEDILCQSRFFFVVSLCLFRLIRALRLDHLKGNMITVFQNAGGERKKGISLK